jgi:hypothetical protein
LTWCSEKPNVYLNGNQALRKRTVAQTNELPPQFETGEVGNGDLRYNIQFRVAGDGLVQQRHVWHRDQFGEHNPPHVDPWINTPSRNLASWAPNARAVPA